MNEISILARIVSSAITILMGFIIHYTIFEDLNLWAWSIGCIVWQIIDGIIAHYRFRKPRIEREHEKFMKKYKKQSKQIDLDTKDPILG